MIARAHRFHPWAFPSASSASRTSANRRSSTRSRPPRPRRRTTRSAPSSRTSASSPCPIRASQALDGVVHADRIVPATIDFVDIAGLVRGAHKGEGLGNQFLAHIREVDAIVQVARCFEDPNVVHVENRVDPVADIATVTTELCLQGPRHRAASARDRARKMLKANNPLEKLAVEICDAARRSTSTTASPRARFQLPDHADAAGILREMQLLTAQADVLHRQRRRGVARATSTATSTSWRSRPAPTPRGRRSSPSAPRSRRRSPSSIRPTAPSSSRARASRSRACTRSSAPASSSSASSRSSPPASTEVRAWTIRKGASAPQAAGVIHTDFEKGFIKAEVIWWEDFVKLGGEAKAREAGKLAIEGKEYVVRDGDVMHFRFNV